MRELHSQSAVFESRSPTVDAPNTEGQRCNTVAVLSQRAQREACATCSSTTWLEAHFVNGSLVCADCAREIRHTQESRPMPPTKSQQMQLVDWIRGPSRGAP